MMSLEALALLVTNDDGRIIVFSKLFAPGFGFQHIVTMNADGTDRRQLTDRPWDDYQPEFTTDRKHIFFARNVGGLVSALWVMNPDESDHRRRTQAPFGAGGVDVSPDGTHMA